MPHAPALDGALFLDAALRPHRSLSAEAFRAMLVAVIAANAAAAFVFIANGAFPVAGFLGLDVLALWLAFRWNYQDAQAAEYVRIAPPSASGAVPGVVTQAQDIGTYWLVTARVGEGADESLLRARLSPEQSIPQVGETVWLSVVGEHTCYYVNEELIA